ncbi:MAG: hypothetical protein MUE72_01820 [Chitinophagaceae bacterium]|nr:hypothetical protein [Chitinophagaceae bacterium]
MSYIIFFVYLAFFCWLITRIPFLKQSGISSTLLISIFCVKVLAGICYAMFYQSPAHYATSDTYRFFNHSLIETDILLNNPLQFLKDLFSSGYSSSGNLFIAENSYWNDLKSNIIIKLLAICNVFSLKNYYTNIIFFNFLFMFGLVALYRLLAKHFQEKKWYLIGCLFFIPSCLFWCSGVHKDGLIVSAIGMLFWYFQQCINNSFTLKKIITIVLLSLLVFSLRNYVFFSVAIVFTAWFLAEKIKKLFTSFTIVYVVGLVIFFNAPYLHPKLNFANYIVIKQQEFKQLSGNSFIETKNLSPNFFSFLAYLPQAIDITFLQPHLNSIKNKSYIPAIVENMLVLILIAGTVFWRKKTNKNSILLTTILFFALTTLLITGYTISFSGAVIRYKSIYLPFLLIAVGYYIKLPTTKAVEQS